MIYFITKEQLPEIENLNIVIKRLENGLTSVSIFPFDITEEMVQSDEIFGINKKVITDLIDRLSFKDNQLARLCNGEEAFVDSWGGLDKDGIERIFYEPVTLAPTTYYSPKRKDKMRWFEGETLYNQRRQVKEEIRQTRVARKQRESTLIYLPETLSDREVLETQPLETSLIEDENLSIIEIKEITNIPNLLDLVLPHLEEDDQLYTWTLVGSDSFAGLFEVIKIGSAIIGSRYLRCIKDRFNTVNIENIEYEELSFNRTFFIHDPDKTLKVERDPAYEKLSYTQFKDYGLYSEEGYIGIPVNSFQHRE